MGKWLKESLLSIFTSEVRQNARRYDLIISLLREQARAINDLNGKAEEFMATQEERLQAILVAVKNVKQMLADLKANNPAIEDEIAAIEGELAPAAEPEPQPEG